jgi:hypothetical protein
LRGGYVLSMDEQLGELPRGDVLIERGVVSAVGARLDVEHAEVLDVSGHVVMPGFIDTHRHTWQTPFRGVCADWTLEDYFRGIRMSISPNCAAEDVYAGNYVGALEGSLTPEVAKGALVFGPGSGSLLDPSLNPMTVSGTDKFAALPGKISAI